MTSQYILTPFNLAGALLNTSAAFFIAAQLLNNAFKMMKISRNKAYRYIVGLYGSHG